MATAPTNEGRAPTYHQLFDAGTIKPERQAEAAKVAKAIFANKAVYESVARKAGNGKASPPYWWIGPTHNRESGMNFRTHLHNGDPLTARTFHVPPGRPASGSPPFAFDVSAADALNMAPHKLGEVQRWSVERGCYEWERFNGWGYLRRGGISAYVFAGTTVYVSGKFVADSDYDPNAVDKQLGTVAVLKELAKLDPDVAKALLDREPGAPPDVIDNETKGAKTGRKIGTGTAAGGAAGEVAKQGTQQPDKPPLFSPVLTMTAIGVGIAIVIIATIMISRKVALINSKWGTVS